MTLNNRRLPYSFSRSPIAKVGLFCLWLLVSCKNNDNPDGVTVAFWTALSENNLEQASYYSTKSSPRLFNDKVRNAAFQIGKVKYICDGATVETRLVRQSAETSYNFQTYLIRDQEEDRWKVDYPATLKNIDRVEDKRFKNIITSTKEKSKTAKVSVGSFFKELGQSFVALFKEMKRRLLS
jgi:hypothetical protein